jgi:hypothetical protein
MHELTQRSSDAAQTEASNEVLAINNFGSAWSIASRLAESDLLPRLYRNRPENVLLALDIAARLKVSFVQVVQNLVVTEGRPAWLAPFLIGAVNTCGRFTGLRFEVETLGKKKVATVMYDSTREGYTPRKETVEIEDKRVRAFTFDVKTGDRVNGTWVSLEMAHTAGWYNRPGTQWPLMEEQMLAYRAGAFFQRLHAPELSVGFLTSEEVGDVVATERTSAPLPLADTIRAAVAAAPTLPAAAVASAVEAAGTPAATKRGRKAAGNSAGASPTPESALLAATATPSPAHAVVSAAATPAEAGTATAVVLPTSGAAGAAAEEEPATAGDAGGGEQTGAHAAEGSAGAADAAPVVPEGCGPLEAAFVLARTAAQLNDALSLFLADRTDESVELEEALFSYVEPILNEVEDGPAARALLTTLYGVIHKSVENKRVQGQLNALYTQHYRRLIPS